MSEHPEDIDIVELHAAEGRRKAPLGFWLGLAALGLLALGFLGSNSGGFVATVYDRESASGEGARVALDPRAEGQRIYSRFCAVCHLPSGEGIPGQSPPLVNSEWVLAQEWHGDNHLVKVVLHGLQGPITVRGKKFQNVMAPWGRVLTDTQISAVLTYIRSEWGNDAPPISPQFVAEVRAAQAGRDHSWTQKELQAIERQISSKPEAAP